MTTAQRKFLSENPKYKVGDIIQVTTSYEALPGIKGLKPGKYVITKFRDSYFTQVKYSKTYDFVLVRKNSTYTYNFDQEWLENNSHLI